MSKLSFVFALLGSAFLAAAATLVLHPSRTRTVTVTVRAAAKPARLVQAPKGFRPVLPKPKHTAHAKHRVHAKPRPKALPLPRYRVTPSLYERTTSPPILRAQGCRAGKAATNGLVILDFGRPAYQHGSYGTETFVDHFASNTAITWAMKAYARGYSECLPKHARAHIILARGTSNYGLNHVPSNYIAGRRWATETLRVAQYLRLHHFTHVVAAAADDVEPAWDRTFHRTRDFLRGYRAAHTGYLLYNYGSLDGGVGNIWSLRQAYYAAGGMRYARAVQEIYNSAMAEEWAKLSRLAVEHFGKPVPIVGVMTQHTKRCRQCGFTAVEAHRALVRELARHPRTRVAQLETVTNIGTPAPVQ